MTSNTTATPKRWPVSLGTCAVLALAALPTHAALVYSDVVLDVRASAFDPFTDPMEHAPPAVRATANDATTHAALLEPSWQRAAMSSSALPAGFVSAAMSADGIGGVGVSGFRRGGPNGIARASFGQDISNTGTDARYLDFTWTIPGIELLIGDTDSFDGVYPSGYPEASVSAAIAYAVLDANGDVVVGDWLFDFTARLLQVSREADDIPFVVTSADLESLSIASCEAGECLGSPARATIGPHEVSGYRWSAFTSSVSGFELLPGHTLSLNYVMSAGAYGGDPNVVDDADLSIQALIGDPFDIHASGALFTIREAAGEPGPDPVPVPEPGSAPLLAAGLGVLLGRRLRVAWRDPASPRPERDAG